jgi:hypothetical protein
MVPINFRAHDIGTLAQGLPSSRESIVASVFPAIAAIIDFVGLKGHLLGFRLR